MKVVYIAGPYRSKDEWGVTLNIRAAEDLALRVWRMGAVALCPHKNTAYFGGAAEDEIWLDGDLELITRCDAVVLVPGWEKSIGTINEVLHAIQRDVPVFEYSFNLSNWLVNYGVKIEDQAALKTKALQRREAYRAQAGAGTQPLQ